MQNIYLIGPMGSGKTTIGRQLAARLGKAFYDSDHEIEKRTGVDVALIFEIEGEQGFRQREMKVIDELADMQDSVIATGGGAILAEANRTRLKNTGQIVYLLSSAEKIYERTSRDKKRPLLNTENRMATINRLIEQRGPVYESLADLVISTDKRSIKNIVSRICSELTESCEK